MILRALIFYILLPQVMVIAVGEAVVPALLPSLMEIRLAGRSALKQDHAFHGRGGTDRLLCAAEKQDTAMEFR
jgi:hypothetical protein